MTKSINFDHFQELYCPPLTIRVVDCRSFGRFTLVKNKFPIIIMIIIYILNYYSRLEPT